MNRSGDSHYMERCLQLAALAEGRTSPNPVVGAVVISSSNSVVGEGFHERAGLAHAEVVALDAAGASASGGTLYVSLEPCSHWGKTPPCIQRVIASGVKRVVAGMVDPNPRVAGAGIAALKEAGIDVEVGVREEECRWLNRGFVKRMASGLPWLCLKLAATLDGKIADRAGTSRWISGPEARAYVHGLRDKFDCVLVGGATALRDDPELNVREIAGGRDPIRSVIDPELSISPDARLCRKGSGGSTFLFCTSDAQQRKGQQYPDHVSIVAVDRDQATAGHVDLRSVLICLAVTGVSTVLCEGGGRLAAGLIAANLVDEIHWIVSPKILGDAESVPAIAPLGQVLLPDARQLQKVSVEQLGADVLVRGILPCGTE